MYSLIQENPLESFAILFFIYASLSFFITKKTNIPEWFYLIDWHYWSWKTTRAVKQILWRLQDPKAYIFTDIYIHKDKLPKSMSDRIFVYDPTRLIDVEKKISRNSNKVKKEQILYYNIMDMLEIARLIKVDRDKSWKTRDDRPKLIFFLDETGAIFDKYDTDHWMLDWLYDYVVQIRKLNGWCFLISQSHAYLSLRLRTLATIVFFNEKYPWLWDDTIIKWWFPYFRHLRVVKQKIVDPETSAVKIEKYQERNEMGKLVRVDIPMITPVETYHVKKYWQYYDDLFMNMKKTVSVPISDFSLSNYFSLFNHFFNTFTKKPIKDESVEPTLQI